MAQLYGSVALGRRVCRHVYRHAYRYVFGRLYRHVYSLAYRNPCGSTRRTCRGDQSSAGCQGSRRHRRQSRLHPRVDREDARAHASRRAAAFLQGNAPFRVAECSIVTGVAKLGLQCLSKYCNPLSKWASLQVPVFSRVAEVYKDYTNAVRG